MSKKILSYFSLHSQWDEKSILDWEKRRRNGPLVFVIEFGIVKWGFFMFIVFASKYYIFDGSDLLLEEIFIEAMIWFLAGLIFGLGLWVMTNYFYNKHAKTTEN